MLHSVSYYFIRILTFPFQWLPLPWIRWIGKYMGRFLFHFFPKYRKRTLSNLALATSLSLDREEMIEVAKRSFENLVITCLEYPFFSSKKSLSPYIRCENPEIAQNLYNQGQGIIFFCGHQANWEVLFLDGSSRMKGVAIGRPIQNKKLYNWILSIRQKCGGRIITPRNAIREGMKSLKKGEFIGIVGDQGMPESPYSFPFFGRRAWTTPMPALLAYKTLCPVIFAETKRTPFGYSIRYADPIWPDPSQTIENEIKKIMDQLLTLLQESIRFNPSDWLWQHNRWKQQTTQILYKQFRHESICILLPENFEEFETINTHLPTFKKIYPLNFITLLIPQKFKDQISIDVDEKIVYSKKEELFLNDFKFKLVFNFTNTKKIEKHYKRLSAFEVLNLKKLKKLARPHLPSHLQSDISEILKKALCRPGKEI